MSSLLLVPTILQCTRDDIPAVYSFSRLVFDNQDTPNHHPTLDEWFTRYDERKGYILVAVDKEDTNGDKVSPSINADSLCSYLFAYESLSVTSSEKKCMHVWLCATDLQHRGQGITRAMFGRVSLEGQNRADISTLAVNTYPAYFPHMYRLLSRSDSGFECVLRKDRTGDCGSEGAVVVEQVSFERCISPVS